MRDFAARFEYLFSLEFGKFLWKVSRPCKLMVITNVIKKSVFVRLVLMDRYR